MNNDENTKGCFDIIYSIFLYTDIDAIYSYINTKDTDKLEVTLKCVKDFKVSPKHSLLIHMTLSLILM